MGRGCRDASRAKSPLANRHQKPAASAPPHGLPAAQNMEKQVMAETTLTLAPDDAGPIQDERQKEMPI